MKFKTILTSFPLFTFLTFLTFLTFFASTISTIAAASTGNTILDNLKAEFNSDDYIKYHDQSKIDFALDVALLSSGKVQMFDVVTSKSNFNEDAPFATLRALNSSFYQALDGKVYNNIYISQYAYLQRNTNLDLMNDKNIRDQNYRQQTNRGLSFIFPDEIQLSSGETIDFQFILTQPLPIIKDMRAKVYSRYLTVDELTNDQIEAVKAATALVGSMPDKIEVNAITDPRVPSSRGEYGLLGSQHDYFKGNAGFIFYYKVNNNRDVFVYYYRISGVQKPGIIPTGIFRSKTISNFRENIGGNILGLRKYFDGRM